MRKIRFLYITHRPVHRVHRFRVHGLDLRQQFLCFFAGRDVLEGTENGLFLIALFRCMRNEQFFIDEAKGPNDTKRHFLHQQHGRHGSERTLVDQVHQHGLNQVVAMMAEGDLIASQFLRNVEKGFAAVPGTEKTGVFN